jgi:hypothetical protein
MKVRPALCSPVVAPRAPLPPPEGPVVFRQLRSPLEIIALWVCVAVKPRGSWGGGGGTGGTYVATQRSPHLHESTAKQNTAVCI